MTFSEYLALLCVLIPLITITAAIIYFRDTQALDSSHKQPIIISSYTRAMAEYMEFYDSRNDYRPNNPSGRQPTRMLSPAEISDFLNSSPFPLTLSMRSARLHGMVRDRQHIIGTNDIDDLDTPRPY